MCCMDDETKSIPVSVRMPVSAIDDLREMAEAKYIPLSTLLRIWVLERVVEEKKIAGVEQHEK